MNNDRDNDMYELNDDDGLYSEFSGTIDAPMTIDEASNLGLLVEFNME